jgi:methyl-accepting chemotaxis protein
MLIAAVAGATVSIVSLSRDQSELQDHNVPYAVAIATAALNAKGIANDERGFLISGDPEFLEEIDQRLLSARTAFSEATITADTDVQRAAASEAHAGFERWIFALQRQLKLFQSGDRQAATKAALGRGRALRKDYETALVEAQDVAARAIESQRNSLASSGWIFILLACLLLVIAGAVGIALWLIRALEPPVPEPEAVGAPIAVFPSPARRSRG